jgi:hypothetical protein
MTAISHREPAKIVFSSTAILPGVIMFESSDAQSTCISICKLFDSKDILKWVFKRKIERLLDLTQQTTKASKDSAP